MKQIIVGVDGNAPAEEAAAKAAALAQDSGGRVHVVCAYAKDQTADLGERTLSIAQESAEIAAMAGAKLGLPGDRVSSAALQGRPADVLLAEAERLGADVIVVGNKRVQGVARVLGSIAGAVAHNANCDVYIAHTH